MKKSFLSVVSLYMMLLLFVSCKQSSLPITLDVPQRPAGQEDVIELRCPPLEKVRIGFIGLGMRGPSAVVRMAHIEGVEIGAICDVEEQKVKNVQKRLKELGKPEAKEYIGQDSWKQLCENENLDLIYIVTPWDAHVPMAVYAMEKGKHAAVEVPATTSLDECWQLVNTAEKTRKHCMMLENCVYDKFELATLNMAQQGLFGEILHGAGAYIHNLEWYFRADGGLKYVEGQGYVPDTTNKHPVGYYKMWRTEHNAKHDGNPYATHGLGPICHAMNIHRGDKMEYLVSMSTKQMGMTNLYAQQYGKDSDVAKREYKKGDMNITLIKTLNGKTIRIEHDVISPRPYSRIHLLSGTEGFAEKWPKSGIALRSYHDAHSYLPQNLLDSILAVYEHPFYKEMGVLAEKLGPIAHGGMDFIMDYRLIYCLRNGLPLDQDVYDAAEWSCLGELTEISCQNSGAPVAIPDFTRGAWNKAKGVKYYTK